MLTYGKRVCGLRERFARIEDFRLQPRIPTAAILRSVFVMVLSRLGSLNSFEQSQPTRFARKWIGGVLPSADTLGRVMALCDLDALRALLYRLYYRLKRNKALSPPQGGLIPLVLDGHECHSSYRRRCAGCCSRRVKNAAGYITQYYHRYVAAQLVTADLRLLLDLEPQRPGEDEVAAAMRLLARVHEQYGRAYDVVVLDALYCEGRVWRFVRERNKHIVVVLKDERRDLAVDARSLFPQTPALIEVSGNTRRELKDIEGFTSWPQVGEPVRVVSSTETTTVRTQIGSNKTEQTSHWLWATSLRSHKAATSTLVALGHMRWNIENQGFNELVNEWHGDHIYKHDPVAIVAFLLMSFLAFNLFHAFYRRNLKGQLRRRMSMRHVGRLILSELNAAWGTVWARAPPSRSDAPSGPGPHPSAD